MPSQEVLLDLAKRAEEGTLRVLKADDEFIVGCEQCGKCCRNRGDIMLSPHDLFHLVKAKGMPVDDLIKKYATVILGSNSNLPIIVVRFREEMDGTTTCPFLGRKDDKFYCRVHDYKPTVCRIYPLGRMTMMAVGSSESQCREVQYFEQPHEYDLCTGLKKAHENNEMHTVEEWVGGKEKKDISDRYWAIFNLYMDKIYQTVDLEEVYKLENVQLKEMCFNMMMSLMYLEYDFNSDDEEFLKKLERNMEKMLGLLSVLAKHPSGKLRPKTQKK